MTAIITAITGTAVPIVGNDIDTDRIIPARYLKEITFEHMGKYLFADARFNSDGTSKQHPLDAPEFKNASIMVVGRNFGCGSSREHAPQSIKRFGIRAIIGESFAEIFAGNCTSLGVPAVTASESTIADIQTQIQRDPNTTITIDLEVKTVTVGNQKYDISLPDARQHAFVKGTWDSSAQLLSHLDQIRETAQKLPYMNGFKR
ncbi:3-isopropylmalate dehydratase small subunit [bacterium]|nr:3-isopropylmalate dehydratase small subunit [bacterium]